MGRRAGLIVIAASCALAAPAQAQDPTPTPTPTPTATPAPAPTPAPLGGCAVTSAGLLCPGLPAGCVVTSAGLLCPGGIAGEDVAQPSPPRRPRERGKTEEEQATSSPPPPQARPQPLRQLAFTGFEGIPVAVAGALLLALGLAVRRRVRA
jgi:hypothetical protein